MAVVISMLRGVNVGGHNLIKMDALRALYESLGLGEVRTYLQSGNVVFKTRERSRHRLSERIAHGIDRRFGIRPDVILRTSSDFRKVIAGNPFAGRREIEPAKLHVTFLPSNPGPKARQEILRIRTAPEELYVSGRELYVYFPNGMGRSRFPWGLIEKTLRMSGTARNWNTVRKLFALAESLEASH
ncbi:MAG: DUF1697 domain-containing protein [Terriglobia bacterium]